MAALLKLSGHVDATGLPRALSELVKIRVSQINGCAFCLKLHLDLARRLALPQVQLDLLATWRDATCFDTRERAALEWAEALTRMATAPVTDAVHQRLAQVFEPREIAALTTAIATINAWNRIAGPLRFVPPGLAG